MISLTPFEAALVKCPYAVASGPRELQGLLSTADFDWQEMFNTVAHLAWENSGIRSYAQAIVVRPVYGYLCLAYRGPSIVRGKHGARHWYTLDSQGLPHLPSYSDIEFERFRQDRQAMFEQLGFAWIYDIVGDEPYFLSLDDIALGTPYFSSKYEAIAYKISRSLESNYAVL